MNTSGITVVITTFERPQKLVRALNSVIAQTYKNFEIIIVDDNKPNSDPRKKTEELESEHKENPQIRFLYHEENLGSCLGRNNGLKAAIGEFISFLDDDDEFMPDKLQTEIDLWSTVPPESKIGFVFSEMIIHYLDGQVSITNRSALFRNGATQLTNHLLRICGYGFVNTSSFLFKKKVLEELGGFPKVLIRQEYTLLLEVLSAGYEGIYIPRVLVKINVSPDGITRKYSQEKEYELKKIYELQKKNDKGLTLLQKAMMKINYYIDVFKYIAITKNYRRLFSLRILK